MFVKLFLLGRPGCGKSSAAKHIIKHLQDKGWSTQRFKDFDILQEMFEKDQSSQRFKASKYGGFDVLVPEVLDEALKELDIQLVRYVKQVKTDEFVLIEFARSNYTEALEKFSVNVLQDAYFLFIDADLNTCIQRIEQRMIDPKPPDDHYVSEEMLQKYYDEQKFPEKEELAGTFEIVYNHGSFQDFTKKVDNFVKDIFK